MSFFHKKIILFFVLLSISSFSIADNLYFSKFHRPKGSDWYYMTGLWRVSSNVSTNHTVIFLKTKDFKRWYEYNGSLVSTPISPGQGDIVDNVSIYSGLLNADIGSDNSQAPVVTYIKNQGNTTQVFNTVYRSGRWVVNQATNYTTKYSFSGGGSLPDSGYKISASSVFRDQNNILYQSYSIGSKVNDNSNIIPISGTWKLDPNTLKPVSRYSPLRLSNPSDPNSRITSKNIKRYVRGAIESDEFYGLEGDWDGDSNKELGLFDTIRSRFIIFGDQGNISKNFGFGSRNNYYSPLVGDWNNNGFETIGIVDRFVTINYLKNSLSGGYADESSTNYSNVVSRSTLAFEKSQYPVSERYKIDWKAHPATRDLPHDCDENGLLDPDENKKPMPYTEGYKVCSKYLSGLYFHEYKNNRWYSKRIDTAWGATKVNYSIYTHGKNIFIVYYNKYLQIVVAHRNKLGNWSYKALSGTRFDGWDSHNYISLGVDNRGYIHISGNLHNNPLIYYRSTQPLNISSFSKMNSMVRPSEESRAAYPRFFRDAQGNFLFSYRQGSSGNGITYINRYTGSSWARQTQLNRLN